MPRIAARAIIADVADKHAIRDTSASDTICRPVCGKALQTTIRCRAKIKLPIVSIFVPAFDKLPAFVGTADVYVSPETFNVTGQQLGRG